MNFSVPLPLLTFFNNVLLVKISLDPACAGRGVHPLGDVPGHG